MRKRATIGVDIGGTKILGALYDDKFRVLDEIKLKTRPEKGEKRFTKSLAEVVGRLTAAAEKRGRVVAAVGAGCACSLEPKTGRIKRFLNMPDLDGYELGKRLTKLSGAPALVGNDVQLGLYGEQRLGAARGYKHVIGVFIGTGVGGAVIIDGKLHVGATGDAGEIGHYLISPMGPLAGSERQGVLDDWISRTAIAGEAASFAAKQWAPALFKLAGTDAGRIRSGTLAQSIDGGDKQIEAMIRCRARTAGIALSNLVDFLNPELVVLGGGMVEAMPALFLKEIGEGIRRHTVKSVREAVKIVPASLKGHATAAGAAHMAWEHFLSHASMGTKD
ncbi:MAG: ROK family protein [Elusimicrobiota bacterium]|nr:MAG: ROK family protein [Elusimicrobiota bacterium]